MFRTSSPLRDYKFPKFSSSNLQASSFLRFPEKTHSFPPPPSQQQPTSEPNPLPISSSSPSTSSFVRLEPSALDAAASNAPTTSSLTTPSTSGSPSSKQAGSATRKQRKLKASAAGIGSGEQPPSAPEAKRRVCGIDRELQLTSEHLYRDETRVLTDMGGLFYAGVMKPLRPPDVYSITLDGERGNKSHVMSREDILKDTVRRILF